MKKTDNPLTVHDVRVMLHKHKLITARQLADRYGFSNDQSLKQRLSICLSTQKTKGEFTTAQNEEGGSLQYGFSDKGRAEFIKKFGADADFLENSIFKEKASKKLEEPLPPLTLPPPLIKQLSRKEQLKLELQDINTRLAATIKQQEQPPLPKPAVVTPKLSLGAQLFDELISSIAERVHVTTKEAIIAEVQREHQRLVDDFEARITTQISELLSSLEKRLYEAFGGPAPEVAKAQPQAEPARTPAPEVEAKKLPRVGIFRLEPSQAEHIRSEYVNRLDLKIAESVGSNQMKQAQRLAETLTDSPIFVMTKFIGHAEEEILKKRGDISRVRGGLTDLKKHLDKFIEMRSEV